MSDADAAIEAWLTLAPRVYDDSTPTPRGIASDLRVYMNGALLYRSVGECRSMWREIQRRYPDWANDFIQAFGDESGQCIVWHATGTAADGSGNDMDLHGVTMIESEAGVVRAVRFYYEADSPHTAYMSQLTLRSVSS